MSLRGWTAQTTTTKTKSLRRMARRVQSDGGRVFVRTRNHQCVAGELLPIERKALKGGRVASRGGGWLRSRQHNSRRTFKLDDMPPNAARGDVIPDLSAIQMRIRVRVCKNRSSRWEEPRTITSNVSRRIWRARR